MSNYIVGSDRSGNNDHDCNEKICEILRQNGNTAENIGVTPNLEGSLKRGKGNIGVFMVNGICIGTFDSVCNMVKAGGCDFVWFACPQSINPSNDWLSCESLKTRKIPIAHDDNFTPEPRRSELNGKYTIAEYCAENSQYVGYACGKDCEEVANAILNGGSGDGASTSGSDDGGNEPTPMTYLDMIKDLISVWDGDVEVKVRQDKMYINKIPKPKPRLWAVESNNIVSGQAKISDYNSDTINTLHVPYNDKTITITDEYLIDRFGVVEATVEAVETVTDYSGDSTGDANATGTSGSGDPNQYTQIAEILQKHFTSNDWNSWINSIRKCKNWDEVKPLITNHKRKSGDNTRYSEIIGQICKVLGVK